MTSGGSMSRTGVAVSAGARTRWAGIVSGVFLALVVLLCGSLAERIPMPVIGGLILCGVEPPLLRLLKRSGAADRLGEDGIVPATHELFGGLDLALATARRRISAEQDRPPF